ncbi:hypothetical protein PS862_05815 [Pseudomonas fluorescens]|uniref:Fap n=1 Tax=Pseudomonas fluorescens TaxID=294 RepID=A0A5E6SHA9_PSEFL|nr:hypothetical protein [Pseudomonas fluorescens]VVM79532.1 hypothetical protein PS639_02200 [Pseudomonas fluorescens]VVP57117.1 hypothetical protein PS862_05815 [Pseudomonas fluorescens]
MGTFNNGLTHLLLVGFATSIISVNAQAEGNGVIVLQRQVQPVHIGRDAGKDPNPTAVNVNPSERITRSLGNAELSDGEFANVASGSSIRNSIPQNGSGMQGLNVITNPNGMPGMRGGNGGGSGNAISGTINRAMTSGLAPLSRLAGGQ